MGLRSPRPRLTQLRLGGTFRKRPVARPALGFHRRAVSVMYRGRARGGFFGDVFKGVKKVVSGISKVPVVGAVAKTLVSSVPVFGGVVTAIGAVQAAVHPPTIANTAVTTSITGATPAGQPMPLTSSSGIHYSAPRKKRRTKKHASSRGSKKRRTKKRASSRGSKKHVSAKQRAARARFARAAKKGRIKKGSHL